MKNLKQPVTIAVVGSGYVGLVASACFAEIGHRVICVDNDEAKIAKLNAGGVPIHEDYLPELLTQHRGGRLEFTTDLRSRGAEAAGNFHCRGNAAEPDWQRRFVVRGCGGERDCTFDRFLQSDC